MVIDKKSGSPGWELLFRRLFDRLSARLIVHALRTCSQRQEAEDIVQTAFLKLLEAGIPLDRPEQTDRFLFTLVRNGSMDYLRRNQTMDRHKKEIWRQFLETPDESPGREDPTPYLLASILAEMEKLPAGCREIFRLSYLGGLGNAQIAARLGISKKTVANQLARAKQRLRLVFKSNSFFPAPLPSCFCLSLLCASSCV